MYVYVTNLVEKQEENENGKEHHQCNNNATTATKQQQIYNIYEGVTENYFHTDWFGTSAPFAMSKDDLLFSRQ